MSSSKTRDVLGLIITVVIIACGVSVWLAAIGKDLNKNIAFKISNASEIKVLGLLSRPQSDIVVNGGLKEFNKEGCDNVFVGWGKDDDRDKVYFIGNKAGKTYLSEEPIDYSFSYVKNVVAGNGEVRVVVAKDIGEVVTFLIAISSLMAIVWLIVVYVFIW